MSEIRRLTVVRGDLTEFPLAQRVRGGWQNGVTFYPDETVSEVRGSYGYLGSLEELLEWLPTHITNVSVSDIKAALAGDPRWGNLLDIEERRGQ